MSEPEPPAIAAVILAAGSSRRLGRPKQLLELQGLPLVRHVALRALQSGVDRVIVVVGAAEAGVRTALDGLAIEGVVNPRFESGQASSLVAGLEAVRDDVDAVIVLLGDQPGIDPLDIAGIMAIRRESGASLAMTSYGVERGHPVLFGREHFNELLALTGDQGGRDVIRRHQHDLVLVPSATNHPPADVDTEDAWQSLRASWPNDPNHS